MNKIEQLAEYFATSDNFQESLDQLYQVYLGACEICKGDANMEKVCRDYLIDQVGDCLGER